MGKVSETVNECVRVLKVTRKPTKEEYTMVVKMSGIGIAIIGIIGFLVTYLRTILFK